MSKRTTKTRSSGRVVDQHSAPIHFQASRNTAPRSSARMSNGDLNWIANYIWGIADDVRRD